MPVFNYMLIKTCSHSTDRQVINDKFHFINFIDDFTDLGLAKFNSGF